MDNTWQAELSGIGILGLVWQYLRLVVVVSAGRVSARIRRNL